MNRLALTLSLAAVSSAAIGTSLPAIAQELPVAPGAFNGFDGISAECIVHTPDKFGQTACDVLFKAAQSAADSAGVKLVRAGVANWDGVPVSDRKHVEPPAGAGLASPVRLSFFIRGANSDNVTGGFIRAAMWTPATTSGRTGKLVLWETATLGTGPRKQLRAAIIKDIAGKLGTPFAAMAAGNAAQ